MRIKRKRFVFNRMKLFYFKEKPTTPLRHGGKTTKKHISVRKLMKTKENGENTQDAERLAEEVQKYPYLQRK